MEKIRTVLRIVVYTGMALMLFLFPDFFVRYAAFAVGAVMVLFGLDEIWGIHLEKGTYLNDPSFFNAILSILLGVFMMIFLYRMSEEDLIKVCVIWGVWSIAQEVYELRGVIRLIRERRLGYLSALESFIVIALSMILILDPWEHVRLHIFILGAELILKYGFPMLYDFLMKRKAAPSAPDKTA